MPNASANVSSISVPSSSTPCSSASVQILQPGDLVVICPADAANRKQALRLQTGESRRGLRNCRKEIRVNQMRQNFEAIDDPRPAAVEISIAVHDVGSIGANGS